jgi:hypothetical protein
MNCLLSWFVSCETLVFELSQGNRILFFEIRLLQRGISLKNDWACIKFMRPLNRVSLHKMNAKWEWCLKVSSAKEMLNMTAFRDIAPCSLVEIHHQDDGGSTHLWNVGILQRDYTVLHPKKLSSYSPPWEPRISQSSCFRLNRSYRMNLISEDDTLLQYSSVLSRRRRPTFQRWVRLYRRASATCLKCSRLVPIHVRLCACALIVCAFVFLSQMYQLRKYC